MKDIVIPAARIKKEIAAVLISLIIAFLINVYSIIKYQTSWVELFSQIGYVVFIAIIIYIISVVLRALIYIAKKVFVKKL